jgi:hypothetical protein
MRGFLDHQSGFTKTPEFSALRALSLLPWKNQQGFLKGGLGQVLT